MLRSDRRSGRVPPDLLSKSRGRLPLSHSMSREMYERMPLLRQKRRRRRSIESSSGVLALRIVTTATTKRIRHILHDHECDAASNMSADGAMVCEGFRNRGDMYHSDLRSRARHSYIITQYPSSSCPSSVFVTPSESSIRVHIASSASARRIRFRLLRSAEDAASRAHDRY